MARLQVEGEVKHYVVGFAFNQKDEVLLVKKIKPSWQFDQWNGLGGKIEDGETPHQTMCREFTEETGQAHLNDYLDWEHKATLFGFFGTLFVFYARGFSHIFEALPKRNDVDEEMKWFAKTMLPGNMVYNLPWLIRFCDEQRIKAPIMIQEPDSDNN